eukprot:905331-Rhodomonas_salina.1
MSAPRTPTWAMPVPDIVQPSQAVSQYRTSRSTRRPAAYVSTAQAAGAEAGGGRGSVASSSSIR